MYFACCSNETAKAGRDFVIAQVDVSAARRANRRSCCAAYLLLSTAIEAFDDPGAFALPQSVKPLHERSGCRSRLRPGVEPRPWRDVRRGPGSRRQKVRAALAAHRAFRGGIFMLFKAAMRTLHTDFNRRRLCHGLALKRLTYARAPNAAVFTGSC